MTQIPAVSVGMPVYNGERYLPETIGAILAQTFQDFELVISDNASTDGSAAICEEFARRDPRIRFVRQERNLGAAANFRYVLDAARAPFFMWAGADDMRSPDFLAVNLDVLRRRPDAVASISPTRFEQGDFNPDQMGDIAIEQPEAARRALDFFFPWFSPWHANARYYSLFRREALLSSRVLRGSDYLASDWAVMLEMLALGKFVRADAGELVLGRHGASSRNLFQFYRRSVLDQVIPLWKFMLFVERFSRPFPWRDRYALLWRAMGLNVEAGAGLIRRIGYERWLRKQGKTGT